MTWLSVVAVLNCASTWYFYGQHRKQRRRADAAEALNEAARHWYRCGACGHVIPVGWAHKRIKGIDVCAIVEAKPSRKVHAEAA